MRLPIVESKSSLAKKFTQIVRHNNFICINLGCNSYFYKSAEIVLKVAFLKLTSAKPSEGFTLLSVKILNLLHFSFRVLNYMEVLS